MAKKTANESILREKPGKAPKIKVTGDKRFKSLKSVSIISVILVIAICIVSNLIIDMTLDKKLTFDTTSVKSYSVSSVTEDFLEKLDKKVEIIGLFDRNDTSIEWRDYFIPLLDDYEAEANGKIDLKYIDPDVDPFILENLDPENIYALRKYTYVVKCGDILTSIYPYNCFEYDPDMRNYYGVDLPIANKIEEIFTVNILYVSSGRPLHAYYISGHNLPSHQKLDDMLKMLGFLSSELDIRSAGSKIPEDCELLILLQPSTDITLSEKETLKSYLDNSGKMLLVTDFSNNKQVAFTNLNEVTRRMGVSLEQGMLHENNGDYLLDVSDPYNSIAVVTSEYNQYIGGVPSAYTIRNCRYMKVERDRSEHVYVSPIVVTSGSASVDFQNEQISSDVSAGTYPVILDCVDDSTKDRSCLIIIGTDTFTSDEYYADKTSEDNNAVLVKQMIHDICPVEYNVIIPNKEIPSYMLSKPLSSSKATRWSIAVMTVIPLCCLVCGVYVYQRRRHL